MHVRNLSDIAKYIDMKKEHARELRKTGNIQYNKMNEKL